MAGKPPAKDKDNMIRVSVGETFELTLEANATTGFQWQLAEPLDSGILELLSSKYYVDERRDVEEGFTGGGGREVWKFRAVGTGRGRLALKYVRPWEKDLPPLETIVYNIRVE